MLGAKEFKDHKHGQVKAFTEIFSLTGISFPCDPSPGRASLEHLCGSWRFRSVPTGTGKVWSCLCRSYIRLLVSWSGIKRQVSTDRVLCNLALFFFKLDLECRGGKGRCCFNGCIYTCDYSDSCETVLETMFENVTNTVCTLEDPVSFVLS